jgi:carbon storage regulator CsrA
MLVLKRRKGEEIWINDEIRIVIAHTSDRSCAIAIDAPDHYRIRRAELAPLDELSLQSCSNASSAQ